jgi:hypothetical protein
MDSGTAFVQAVLRGGASAASAAMLPDESQRVVKLMDEAIEVWRLLDKWCKEMDRPQRRGVEGAPATGAGSDEATAMVRRARAMLGRYLWSNALRKHSVETLYPFWMAYATAVAWRRTRVDSYTALYGTEAVARWCDPASVEQYLNTVTYPETCGKLLRQNGDEFDRVQARFARALDSAGDDAVTRLRIPWTMTVAVELRRLLARAAGLPLPAEVLERGRAWFVARLAAKSQPGSLTLDSISANFRELLPMAMRVWAKRKDGLALFRVYDANSDAIQNLPLATCRRLRDRAALVPSSDAEAIARDARVAQLWFLRMWCAVFEMGLPPKASARMTGRQHQSVNFRFMEHVVRWSDLTVQQRYMKTRRERGVEVGRQFPVIVDAGCSWLLLLFTRERTEVYGSEDVRDVLIGWYVALAVRGNMSMPDGIDLPAMPWYTATHNAQLVAARNREGV